MFPCMRHRSTWEAPEIPRAPIDKSVSYLDLYAMVFSGWLRGTSYITGILTNKKT